MGILVGGSSNPPKGMNLKYVPSRIVDGQMHLSPPESVAEKGAQSWDNCIVGHFVGTKLSFPVVNLIARKIWTREGLVEVLAQEHGFYFFKFSNSQGKDAILDRGPWLFVGRQYVLQNYELGLKLNKEEVRKLPVWVQLHNVPVEYWTEEGLSILASAVGVPFYADHATETYKQISYAQICVEVSADKPLIDSFEVDIFSSRSPGKPYGSISVRVAY